MMMLKTAVADDDWASLSDEWKAVPAPVEIDELRAKVHAQSRRMRLVLALELALTVGAMAALALAARGARTWDAWLVIGGLSLFTAVIWSFNLRNRRGIWRAEADTLEGYRALEVARRHRQFMAATFTRRLSIAGLFPLGALAAVRYQEAGERMTALPVLVSLGAMLYLLGWALAAWRMERRLRG